MSKERMKQAVRDSEAFRGNKVFRCGDARLWISRRCLSVSSQRAAEVLRDMIDSGELERLEGHRYQRRSSARRELRRPWRTISNQELGIESMQFGVMA